jgi:hypothetical protein
MRAMSSLQRLFAAAAALGLWLALFFLGRTAGGAIHLLPIAALVLLFWPTRPGDGFRSRQDEENQP